jgi:Mce-associated membrane protein
VIAAVADDIDDDQRAPLQRRRIGWRPVVTYGVLPALAILLAVGVGYLKWQNAAAERDQVAATESVRAATDGTVAMLSYRPDTVQRDLDSARSRLTGQFLDSYTSLTDDVVIPGAQQKQIAATATVPAAASASATGTHAVVLLFVNQTTTVGPGTPTSTASSVRVTLDRVNGRWLISQFDPV